MGKGLFLLNNFRILHILTSARSEGTPRLVQDWLSVYGYDQFVLLMNNHPNDLINEFNIAAKDLIVNHDNLGRNALSRWINRLRITKKVTQKYKPDLVISWNQGHSHWHLIGSRLGGCKKLISHAGNPPHYSTFKERLYNYFLYIPLFVIAAKVVACSEYIKSEFYKLKLLPERLFYSVYNCAHIERFDLPAKAKNYDVVMVATIESHKDHDTLLKAWQKVNEANNNMKLALAGDGRLMDHYKKLAKSLNLQGVYFLGSVNNIPDLLSESDIFVLSTTEQEGFGTVLVEALAAGKYIIASDVPACREVLKDGMYGDLVPKRNPEELAKKILSAKKNEQQTMHNKEYSKQFTPEIMVKKYISIANG